MTFQEYVSNHKVSVRALYGIRKCGINEYSSSHAISVIRGIGRDAKNEIEQLQQDYIKTFDVAYQQVIKSIRNRKEVN